MAGGHILDLSTGTVVAMVNVQDLTPAEADTIANLIVEALEGFASEEEQGVMQ